MGKNPLGSGFHKYLVNIFNRSTIMFFEYIIELITTYTPHSLSLGRPKPPRPGRGRDHQRSAAGPARGWALGPLSA